MKYVCIRDCYFNGRLYHKGDEETIDKGAHVPEHFAPAKKPVEEQLKEAVMQGKSERLEDLNIFTLKAMARAAGIEVPANATKQETIAAMRSE